MPTQYLINLSLLQLIGIYREGTFDDKNIKD